MSKIRDGNGYSGVEFFYIHTILIIHLIKFLNIHILFIEFQVPV
jgi:hypothetical protein